MSLSPGETGPVDIASPDIFKVSGMVIVIVVRPETMGILSFFTSSIPSTIIE